MTDPTDNSKHAIWFTPSHVEGVWPFTRRSKGTKKHPSRIVLEEPESCYRRYWFRNVAKLPTIQRHGGAFGDVLHAVVERWLGADDNGCDPKTGQPVDPYPRGWEVAVDRLTGRYGDALSPVEQECLRKLVAEAIAKGLLYRAPGRRVEVPFNVILPLSEGRTARLHGLRDVVVGVPIPNEVWDHKTHKLRKYARSKPRVPRSPQLLCYALATYEEALARGVDLPEVRVRHVVFIKDPQDLLVKETPGVISREALLTFRERLIEVAEELVRVRQATSPDQVREPGNPQKACISYGGCPFSIVCHDRVPVEEFKARVQNEVKRRENSSENALTLPPPVIVLGRSISGAQQLRNAGVGPMGSFDDRLARLSAMNKTGAPAAAAPKLGIAPQAQSSTPSGPQNTAAASKPALPVAAKSAAPSGVAQPPPATQLPWANKDCPACNGVGLNSQGNGCRICDATATKRGVLPSTAYVIMSDGAGGVIFELRAASGTPAPANFALPNPPGEVASQTDNGLDATAMEQALEQGTTELPGVEGSDQSEEQDDGGDAEEEDHEEGTGGGYVDGSAADAELPVAELVTQPAAQVTATPTPTPTPPTLPVTQQPGQPEAPRKGKGGRPKGSPNKAKPPVVVNTGDQAAAVGALSEGAPINASIQAPTIKPEDRDLTLIVDATFESTGVEKSNVMRLDEAFDMFANLLAQQQLAPSYWHLHTWRRRDVIRSWGPAMAACLNGKVIVGQANCPDLVAFVVALRPWATTFVQGR